MTTPSSSSLSHALHPPPVQQSSQAPRLQLAPPEHQKHLQSQAQARQQQQQHQEISPIISPATRRSDDPTSPSSSREVSPAGGVETLHPATGDKRKSVPPKNASSKKRRTDDPVQEEPRDLPIQYGLGTHYPFAYAYPGAPPPPPIPPFHPPLGTNSNAEMGFNEFQWRLLNLCGEFYEAATELIRATPHLVLSQAFQLLGRGTGLDPISVLNDARRTCDMMLVNPQAFATAPPPPTALSLPVLTSLAHLNSRSNVTTVPMPMPVSVPGAAQSSYYPPPSNAPDPTTSSKGKEKERSASNVQGTWKEHEVQKLKDLAEKYRVRDRAAIAQEEEEEEEDVEDAEGVPDGEAATQAAKKAKELGDINWDKVVAEFGDERSRHQVLIKATYLGLKPSSSVPGKKPKKKKQPVVSVEPPPPTFSSASAKSIPVGYSASQLGASQSPSASPGVSNPAPTTTTAPQPAPVVSASNVNSSPEAQKTVVPPPPIHAPQHAHPHTQYAQPGWYPHPQNPYYAYHQPMYYSAHPPQGYGMQSYGIHTPPQQGYYPPPYVPPPASVTAAGSDVSSTPVEKQAPNKGKRKESAKKANGPSTPVPPPSLPPKPAASEAAKPADTQASAGSTPGASPVVLPASASVSAPASASASAPGGAAAGTSTTGSSGVLRRGPNNSLFTYTPLPHGPGGVSATEQAK